MNTSKTVDHPDFRPSSSGISTQIDDPVNRVHEQDFHTRLNLAAGGCSYRKLGKLTNTHPETVRRYMNGQAPSASYLTSLCRVMGVSGEWLLTGRGPMKCKEIKSHALNEADPSELMTAVANTLTKLCHRMDRLERYVQMLETRIRGASTLDQLNTVTQPPSPLETSMCLESPISESSSSTDRATVSTHHSPNHSASNAVGESQEFSSDVVDIEPKPNPRRAKPLNRVSGGHAESADLSSSAQRIRDAISKRTS